MRASARGIADADGRVAVPIVLAIVLAVVLAGLAGWYGLRRVQELEERVTTLNQEVAEADARAREARAAADAAGAAAEDAGTRARDAEERAQQQEAELSAAEEDQRIARAEARIARDQAAEAERVAEQARAEADRIREERQQEIARLEGALGEIADTQRTALGLVMNLGEDAINFDTDRAELKPADKELLSRIAGVLLTTRDYRVQIFGHTDDVASDEYNQGLSERRAQAVAEYLAQAGIDATIMTVRGYGESKPLVEGTGPEARARNRRVELGIIDTMVEFTRTAPEDRQQEDRR